MMAFLFTVASASTWDLAYTRQTRDHYVLPARGTRMAYSQLIAELAQDAPAGIVPSEASAKAQELGLEVRVQDDVVYLLEPDAHHRGAGLVAIRLGPLTEELVIQAPHPLADRSTGAITGALFDLGDVRAVVIATVHREAGKDADPSALARSWLGTATDGLARGLDSAMFVQLHGFDDGTSDADAVVSAGVGQPGADAYRSVARRLAIGLDVADVRTGEDVPLLAASKNAQGKALAQRGLRFWHIEMSAELRYDVSHSKRRRAELHEQLLLLAGERQPARRRR